MTSRPPEASRETPLELEPSSAGSPSTEAPPSAAQLEIITEVLVSIASGRFDVRAPRSNSGDPWDVLAYLANETAEEVKRLVAQLHAERCELEEAQERLHRTEKLAALGELAGGVAHELNQPLTVMQSVAELLLEKPEKTIADCRRELELMSAASRRMGRIVSAIRTFGRQAPLDFSRLDLLEPIRKALLLFENQLEAAHIGVKLRVPEVTPYVWGDCDALQQVFINLLSNARDILEEHSGEDRLIVLSVESSEAHHLVRVYDNGPGVPEEAVSRLFDPFFSTKSVGRGTGLGLSISAKLVSEHAGEIFYETGPLGGACFVMQFPRDVLREGEG